MKLSQGQFQARVVDSEFNRKNYFTLIGKMYEAHLVPAYVQVEIVLVIEGN